MTHLREGTIFTRGGENRVSGSQRKMPEEKTELTVPDVAMVREAVSNETKLSLLCVLEDWVQGFLL